MRRFPLSDVYSSIERLDNSIPVENLSNRIRFGEHKSVFKSEGHDFDHIKEYDPEEDSIFEILWNSMGPDKKLYVRKAVAAKEFLGIVMGDVSSSMAFGVDYQFKARMLLEVIGNVGMTCIHGQDPMGFIGFAENILFDEPPKLGPDHMDHIIEEVYHFFQDISSGDNPFPKNKTDFENAFRFFSEKYHDQECFLVVVSDFIGAENIADSRILRDIATQHEVVFIFLDDPTEFEASWGAGHIELENMETGGRLEVSRRKMRKLYLDTRRKRKEMRNKLNDLGIDCMVLEYGKQFQRLVRIFMARRESFRV